MDKNNKAAQQRDSSGNSDHSWRPTSVKLTVATSLEDDTPIQVNLIETMEHKDKGDGYKHNVKNSPSLSAYWLPSKFNHASSEFIKKHLMPHFGVSCLHAGFKIKNKGWEKKKGCLTIVCPRHRYYSPKHCEESKRRSTVYPIRGVDKVCPFHFQVFFNSKQSRWYIPRRQGGKITHVGHFILGPDQVLQTKEELSNLLDYMGAYNAMLPNYWECTKNIQTGEQLKILSDALSQAHKDIMAASGDVASTGMVSLPTESDERTAQKRKTPYKSGEEASAQVLASKFQRK
ncbi:expressed unknown protein [Seminavis robusta]|uniref:Uncharacterized protein n=1 Tax=Seminavis robusta TaxID=568900 RepID=A0A9N8EAX5_9STRA|nr:expressed unknown protein [Seminavis robusta]|eukprot:Sro903_g218260.1 n/a (288) ;mRNA; f:18202-19179